MMRSHLLWVAIMGATSVSLPAKITLHYADLQKSNSLQQPWCVETSTILEGHFSRLYLEAPLHIAAHTTVTLRNCVLEKVCNDTLIFDDDTSCLILENSVLLLEGDYQFSQGSLAVKGMSELRGPFTWHHTSNHQCHITKNSTLLCSKCCYYYDPTQNHQKGITFANQNATLMLHSAELRSGPGGLLLTGGTLSIHETCTTYAQGDSEKNGIILGNGKWHNNMKFILATPQSRLRIIKPHLKENKFLLKKIWQSLAWGLVACAGVGIGILTSPKK